VLGALLSLKHYERNRFHTKVMKAVRDEITRLEKHPREQPKSTDVLRQEGETANASDFSLRGKKVTEGPWLVRTHLFHLWVALPLAIAAVGVVIVVFSVV
jgi:hypothetical protein